MNQNTESFKISPALKKLLIKTLDQCGDQLDLSGWRYSKLLGVDEYIPIDIKDDEKLLQFHICFHFLKTFFPRKYRSETVYSTDLKSGAESWWEDTEKKLISLDNGIMLAAIVARGLCPEDLWYSMNISQQALVSPNKWKKFCDKYNHKYKQTWSDDESDENDIIKIN